MAFIDGDQALLEAGIVILDRLPPRCLDSACLISSNPYSSVFVEFELLCFTRTFLHLDVCSSH
uniref:Uncharacterized protein n=1 Tax=Arundo donax TaxID=35708 RepID=A0A0A9FFC4_ARUDO